MALKLNERYPGRFDNPSAEYPQGSFKNRSTPTAKDGSYLEKDWANDKEGFFQSLLFEAGVVANGAVDEVGASQYYAAMLQIMQEQSTDYLNTLRIDVASAATVDLSAVAPDTRNIRITGVAAITAFTVSGGQTYIVSFSGACTLTNNAAIVTNSGGSITTASGDSCVIRATAANTVEILCYVRGIRQALGDGQTWQNLTASRFAGTTYTNTTGRSILIQIYPNTSTSGTASLSVGGVVVAQAPLVGNNNTRRSMLTAVVPNGQTYIATIASGIDTWVELR